MTGSAPDGTCAQIVHRSRFRFCFHAADLQGDAAAILDSTGKAVVKYSCDAWGKLLSTTGSLASTLGVHNPLRYRGYVYDSETGLYYLQSRYYDPGMGRFIHADSFASTGQGILSHNMFVYCLNNPTSTSDPTGSFPWHIIIPGSIGAGVGVLSTWATGGNLEEIAISGIRGALVGGALVAFPNAAGYIVGADTLWTIVEVWGDGASVNDGLIVGLISWICSYPLPGIDHKVLKYFVDAILSAVVDLTASAIIELVVDEDYNSLPDDYDIQDSYIGNGYSPGGGGGSIRKNTVFVLF